MNYTQVKNISGMILLIDFEKAFDTVSWDYLFRVMKLFNFGTSIINWIKTFYKDITTTIN
jgi:plasmid rolling circle replication initiator protein Rep